MVGVCVESNTLTPSELKTKCEKEQPAVESFKQIIQHNKCKTKTYSSLENSSFFTAYLSWYI